jgi:hypothetical protein
MLQRNHAGPGSLPLSAEARLQAQATQQKLEQEANEHLARLAQQQQQQRQEHPAKNRQLAAAQQKADDKQLTLLAVKNYRDVFLPGQVATAQQAQQLSPRAEQNLRKLNEDLLNDAWWSKQEAGQVVGSVKAYSDTLTSLTTGLLGFNLSSPPAKPAPTPLGNLNDKLKQDLFDQKAATQLIHDAALTERLLASKDLIKAVQDFATVATADASSSAPQSEFKKLRKNAQKSLRTVTKELARYNENVASAGQLYWLEVGLRKSTSTYLAKNSK